MSKKSKRKNRTREPLEHYDPPFEEQEEVEETRTVYRTTLVYLIDQDEVNALIDASTAEYVEPIQPVETIHQRSYTQEEVFQLVNGEAITTRKPSQKKKK